MEIALSVILIITSVVMVLLVLLHKGKGGGLSDLFGGGVSSTLGSSSVVERNLDRITDLLRRALVRLRRGPGLAHQPPELTRVCAFAPHAARSSDEMKRPALSSLLRLEQGSVSSGIASKL